MSIDTQQLDQLQLPASTYRNALRLAAVVHPDNGHVALTLDHLGDIFGGISPATARAHLSRLRSAGWLIYAKNNGSDWYYITILELADGVTYTTEPAQPASESRVGDRNSRTTDTEIAHQHNDPHADTDPQSRVGDRNSRTTDTKNARGRAKNAPIRNWMDGWISDLTISEKNPTIQSTDERKRSRILLTAPEIGVNLRIADALSKTQPAADLFRQCCGYLWDQHLGILNGSGALLYRLAHSDEFPPPPILPSWRGLPFFCRYATDQERSAADPEARNYSPDEYADIIRS